MMKYLQIVVIDGMNCSRCASKVRNALEAEPTVSVKIVDLARGTVTFDADSKLTLTFL
ncbi:TPA: heavy-metal-associated domain-containing protein, partial [Enterococcus faecium]|nr:heavy-metal transporter [Enterococcus faecium]